MIRHGHHNCLVYGVSFFYDCLEEIGESQKEYIQHTAISVRGANVEKFDKFLKEYD